MLFKADFSKKPINPVPNTMDWKKIPITECGEPLVPLGPFSEYPSIFQDSIYFGERQSSPYRRGKLKGALLTPFLRKGVAEKLEEASKLLPKGYAFMIWDGYRPLSVQRALFEDYRDQLMIKNGWPKNVAEEKAQTMVSIPSQDPTRPSPHNTGGSVDLTIVKFSQQAWAEMQEHNQKLRSDDWRVVYHAEQQRWKLLLETEQLDMGGGFDETAPEETIAGRVTNRTETGYFELKKTAGILSKEERTVLENRRLLVNTLSCVGLSNYAPEWWHFDFGNQFHAQRTGEPAIYGAADFSVECQNYEDMRLGNLNRNEEFNKSPLLPVRLANELGDPHIKFVGHEALQLGLTHIQLRHPKAYSLTA